MRPASWQEKRRHDMGLRQGVARLGQLIRRDSSLAERLVISAICWCVLIFVVAGLILTAIYNRATERAFDERLQVYLTGLVSEMAAPVGADGKERVGIGEPRFDLPLSGWYWQIARTGGRPGDIRASRSLFGSQLQPLPPRAARHEATRNDGVRSGYVVGPDDRRLRVISRTIDFGDEGRFDIAVAGPADEIEAEKREFIIYVTLTFVLLGLALALSTLLQVRFGLAPLTRLRSAIEKVRHGDSDHIGGSYPRDVAPLATELNLLIDANRKILDRARTQVGNLAHALKTPLSVIVNDAEQIAGAAGGSGFPTRVRDQAAIMRNQINYYLDRARAAALAGALGAFADVGPVVNGLTRTLLRIHAGRDIALDVSVEEGLRFRGEAQDLQDMIGNLTDNAFKWGRSRVVITAGVMNADGAPTIRIAVDDDGPGLAAEAWADAMARGKRLDEAKPGSGLGLSIVADLAEMYGGALQLQKSALGGLRAELSLPGVVALPQTVN